MEKRVIFAIILSFLAVSVYYRLFPPAIPDPVKEETPATSSGERDPAERSGEGPGAEAPVPGTAAGAGASGEPAKPAVGHLDESVEAVDGELVLQDSKHRFRFSQRGGCVEDAWLLEHREDVAAPRVDDYTDKLHLIRTYEGGRRALVLLDDDLPGLADALWRPIPANDGRSMAFELEAVATTPGSTAESRYRLTKTFSLTEHANRISVTVGLELLSGEAAVTKSLWLSTSGGVFPPDRLGSAVGPTHSVVGEVGSGGALTLSSVNVHELVKDSREARPFPLAHFACDMGIYFGAYLRWVDGGKSQGVRVAAIDTGITSTIDEEKLERFGPPRTWSQVGIGLVVDGQTKRNSATFDYYLGPKDHRIIKANYDGPERTEYLEVADSELTSQGMMCCTAGPIGFTVQAVSKAVVGALSLFNGIFGNMGIAIIVLTFCVRTLMFPITRKSQTAMHKHSKDLARLKPKLEKLKEKYKDDQKKFASEQFALMKREKVKMVPLGGCLPMLLQIPIFFGLFSAIRFDVDLRHAPFLWCTDLSMPDALISWTPFIAKPCFGMDFFTLNVSGLNILPILMTIAWFVNQAMMPKSPDPQMQQQQKMMLFMPVIFGLFMYGYAAGLSLYWLTSSLFGIFEQRVIKKAFPLDKDEPAVVAAT